MAGDKQAHLVNWSHLEPYGESISKYCHGPNSPLWKETCKRTKEDLATVKEELHKRGTFWYWSPKITNDRLKWKENVTCCCNAVGETR